MCHQNGLRSLQMRVSRHRILAGVLRLLHEFAQKFQQRLRYGVDLLAHIQPQAGRNLLVAAAPGVQLVTHLTGQLHQSLLDEVVHIFDCGIVILGHAFAPNLVQSGQGCRKLTLIQNARRCQRGSMCPARRHFVRQQRTVEGERALPLLEVRILRLAETAGPHLHFKLSA